MPLQIISNKSKEDELVSGFLLEKTAKLMKLHFSRRLLLHPDIDITVDQWIILDILQNQNPENQQQLAEMAMKDAPTVTRILDILEQKNYISRKLNPEDRRKFNIVLLKAGESIYDKVWPMAQQFRAECYNDLSPTELNIFKNVLSKIHNKLSNHV